MIRPVQFTDAESICEIYNHYVIHTWVTFEEIVVPASEMKERIKVITEKFLWLVYEENGKVMGYAYAGEWKTRTAYRHTCESTIYLHPEHTGKGIGRKLYHELLEQLKALEMHIVIGGIALPNEGSIALHEKCGFVKTAHFREVGFKFQEWIDVVYLQKIF